MIEKNKVYTLSEFCKVLKESQEFKPVKGKNVENEDKENNDKAVNDILKQSKKFDGGISNKNKKENPRDSVDFNKTTIEVDFDNEPSDEYKKRVKALAHGFYSEENEKNTNVEKDNESLLFDGNRDFYKERKKISDLRNDRKYQLKKSGLQSRELAKDKDFNDEFKNKTAFTNENKKMKRLHFGKTVFLDESHMMSKIPDDMKVDGNKFLMKDAAGNEYLIECVKDEVLQGITHTKVIGYENKEKLNETFNRMKELYGYKSSQISQKTSVNENNMVGKILAESKKSLTNNGEE